MFRMRATLQIDDDVYEVARSLAAAERRSLGDRCRFHDRILREGEPWTS